MRVDTMLKVTMSTVDGHNSTTLGSRTPSPQYKVGGDDGQTKTKKKYIAGAINFVLGGRGRKYASVGVLWPATV